MLALLVRTELKDGELERRIEALHYAKSLGTGPAYIYARGLLFTMRGEPWPDRPKRLGQSRAQHITDRLGDILEYWR